MDGEMEAQRGELGDLPKVARSGRAVAPEVIQGHVGAAGVPCRPALW